MSDNIDVTIVEEAINVEMKDGATWNGISDKPTAAQESSFIVSGASPFAWLVKTLEQIKTILGLGSAAYTDSTDYAVLDHNHAILDLDHIWTGTEAEYEALGIWDDETLYFNTE